MTTSPIQRKPPIRRKPNSDQLELKATIEDNTYKRRREQIISKVADVIKQHHEAGRGAVWKGIAHLTCKKARPPALIAADSIEDQLSKVHDHFRALLNAPHPPV